MKSEKIPVDHHLYRRVNDNCYDALSGKCKEGAFLLRKLRMGSLFRSEEYLSVDWAERTNLEKSCLCPKSGKKYKIAELQVKVPIELELRVEHKPSKTNIAHSGILGKKLHDDVQSMIIASQLAEKSKIHLP